MATIPPESPLPLRVWLRGRNANQGGRDHSNRIIYAPPPVFSFSTILEYTPWTRSSSFELDGPSKVTVAHSGSEEVTAGQGGHPGFTPLNPENSPGACLTESDGSKPGKTVGVLWGPDSFLFCYDILSKISSNAVERLMDSHSVTHSFFLFDVDTCL